MFHADGQTDGRTDVHTERHDEANSRFSHFAKAPINVSQTHPSSETVTSNCNVRDDNT